MTEINLDDAFDGLIDVLKDQFDTFNTVAAEDEGRKKLKTPALLLQLSELEPDPDRRAHDGTWPCLVRIEARIVLGHRTPKVRREVAKAAGAIASFVDQNRFGSRWGAAEIIAVEPDEFSPLIQQYDVWRIEWTHACDLGDRFDAGPAAAPTEVLVSWAPEIGLGNEGAYVPEPTDE